MPRTRPLSIPVPRTALFPHQIPAVEKMLRLLIGALFMDMGTGKTRCAIELALRRLARGRIVRVLWFCPVTLKATIAAELDKHLAQTGGVHVFRDSTTVRRIHALRESVTTWFVCGTESLSSSDRTALAVAALVDAETMVILDESHYIKTPHAIRTKRIIGLCESARYRLLLTGTSITQGVQDLYAQLKFLSPDILGYRSWYTFQANHLVYHDTKRGLIIGTRNTHWIAAKIAPYVYQVQKDECLDLPEKIYAVRYCNPTSVQRRLYEDTKELILSQIEDWDDIDNGITIYRLFSALQQIACGFWTQYPFVTRRKYNEWGREKVQSHKDAGKVLHEVDHARLTLLESVVAGEIPAAAPVIVWAKYQRCLHEIAATLSPHGASVLYYGGMTTNEREIAVARFRSGEARFFVATPATGGQGLTLNEASHVIFYTNEFRYSTRVQAEDRNHRIGQTRPVTYVSIVCQNTIDTRIETVLGTKQNIVADFRQRVQAARDQTSGKKAMKATIRELMKEL